MVLNEKLHNDWSFIRQSNDSAHRTAAQDYLYIVSTIINKWAQNKISKITKSIQEFSSSDRKGNIKIMVTKTFAKVGKYELRIKLINLLVQKSELKYY